jgi:hypothetical protein
VAINQLITCKMCGKKYQIFIPKADLYAVEGVTDKVLSCWRRVDFQEELDGGIIASKAVADREGAEFIDSREMKYFRCRGCGSFWKMEALIKAMRYIPGPTLIITLQL